ncbi:MAG: rubrerythrin [Phycisphaerae bacterium]
MSSSFNADEIFAVAERIEANGARFYRKAAERASGGPRAGMLMELAAMEEKHQKTFADMRAALTAREQRPAVPDPNGEAAAYLAAMADGRVFTAGDPAARLTGDEPPEEVLRTAIGLEKDSIAFYVGIMEFVPPELGKFRVADIIKEEMRHVVILNGELARRQA